MDKEQDAKLKADIKEVRRIVEEEVALKDQLRDAILDHNQGLIEQLARQIVGLPRQSTQ